MSFFQLLIQIGQLGLGSFLCGSVFFDGISAGEICVPQTLNFLFELGFLHLKRCEFIRSAVSGADKVVLKWFRGNHIMLEATDQSVLEKISADVLRGFAAART